MSIDTERVIQTFNKALQLINEQDPYAALSETSAVPAAYHQDLYYLFIRMMAAFQLRRRMECTTWIDGIARHGEVPADIVNQTLGVAMQFHYGSPGLSKACPAWLRNPDTQAAAAWYLLSNGLYAPLIDAGDSLRNADAVINLAHALAYSHRPGPALAQLHRLPIGERVKRTVAPLLLSLERMQEAPVTPPLTAAFTGRLAVITPLGPGHEHIVERCRE